MKRFDKTKDVWALKPTEEDLIAGARYASLTLPWTFNRMMMNTSPLGQQWRALNIAKGIVAQEALRRALIERGVKAEIQRKSHREVDQWDFRIITEADAFKLDVKSINYYSDYAGTGRESFSPKLIVKNSDYPGPDWRYFFPMLVPHTQIGQGKEAYCFAITGSIDFRRDVFTNRIDYQLAAFPYGESIGFMGSRKLCLARESAGQGFYIGCSYEPASLLSSQEISLTFLGEWDGVVQVKPIVVRIGDKVSGLGPFSCLASILIEKESFEGLEGQIEVSVSGNDFLTPIYNASKQNMNVKPDDSLKFTRKDFCNLVLPSDYTMYVVGWITKEEFLNKCREYTGWVWPSDKVNRFENQPWSTITDSDRKLVSHHGFEDCIQKKPPLLKAGWMKTTGKGGGACCYVFPNIGRQGGVKETNLYILPKDLCVLDDLGSSDEK